MGTALWIAQVLLAVVFFMAGLMKVSQPIERLQERMAWVKRVSPWLVRLVGALELVAAIGLVVPAVTGILPVLTPLAALGLILTMVGAIGVHAPKGEYSGIATNVVLLALAAFVAYGRLVLVPLTS
jgi:uncharacterized membrane protein YphA (DoxX/SURF4 family)